MRNGTSIFCRRSFAAGIASSLVYSIPVREAVTNNRFGRAPTFPPIEPDEAEALAQQYADAQAAKNADDIVALFFEDGDYVDSQNVNDGLRHGRDQIGEYFMQLYQSYPDLSFTIDVVAAHSSIEPASNAVAGVMWTFNGVHSKSSNIAGLATNQQIFISGYDQLVISRNQSGELMIVSVKSYYDGAEFAGQDSAD